MREVAASLKRRTLDHFGLIRPYRFERTLALLAAFAMAIVVGGGALALWSRGGGFSWGTPRGLSWGTPRGWYFLYLAVLLALGAGVARWPRAAAAVLSLAALEIGLGFGSALLYLGHLTLSPVLFPNNYNRPLYGWHPLLQALPMPTPPRQAGTARVFINSEHMRGPERTPQQLRDKIVVALFGGSTTMDFASPDGQSWGDRLEQTLGPRRYAVINHGVPGYTTAENLIQTAFYEQAFATWPRCALYYSGWNDLTNAHIQGLDPGYADFHMRGQIDFLQVRRLEAPLITVSPTLNLLTRFAVLAFDTARPAGKPPGRSSAAPDPRLEEIYRRNVRAISAINRQRGITTVWIGQVMNRTALTSDVMRGWLQFVPDRAMEPLIERLNSVLRQEAEALGDVYADIPAAAFQPGDFIDEGHFSPAGSLKFATRLAPIVANACR